MDLSDLFNGIAVVIDDEVYEPKANINKIIRQLESKNIPHLKYDSIPEESCLRHLHSLSFVLLDWRLIKGDIGDVLIEEGVSIPAALQEEDVNENIVFLRQLREICFCPVFIFTNEDENTILEALSDNGLFDSDKPNYIFIKSKSDLSNDVLLNEINEWLERNPSIYLLKEWEKEYHLSKNRLFLDFQNLTPHWPKIIWDNYLDDGVSPSKELGDVITRNLCNRMTPFEFDGKVISTSDAHVSKDEIRKVLEGARYLRKLNDKDIGTGDIFKERDSDTNEDVYYINIRANCDLVRNRNPKLYCLKGKQVNENDISSTGEIRFHNGHFLEKVNHTYIPFIDNGKIIEIKFRDIHVKKWNSLKANRIGRVLPPYINRIQQLYSLYMQRQGLPRIPSSAIGIE